MKHSQEGGRTLQLKFHQGTGLTANFSRNDDWKTARTRNSSGTYRVLLIIEESLVARLECIMIKLHVTFAKKAIVTLKVGRRRDLRRVFFPYRFPL